MASRNVTVFRIRVYGKLSAWPTYSASPQLFSLLRQPTLLFLFLNTKRRLLHFNASVLSLDQRRRKVLYSRKTYHLATKRILIALFIFVLYGAYTYN